MWLLEALGALAEGLVHGRSRAGCLLIVLGSLAVAVVCGVVLRVLLS